jgi:DNA-directed RNA polymerase-3 subunit RPC5
MTVKQATDNDEDAEIPMTTRIRQAQEEPWRKLRYVDENSGEAWDTFEELFVPNKEMDGEPEKKEDTKEGEAVEPTEPTEPTADPPRLQSVMNNVQYLDYISAPRDAARLSRSKRTKGAKEGAEGAGNDSESESDEE